MKLQIITLLGHYFMESFFLKYFLSHQKELTLLVRHYLVEFKNIKYILHIVKKRSF